MEKTNWTEESDEDEKLSAVIATTFEWGEPSPNNDEYTTIPPWNDEYNITPMLPTLPQKLRQDDVMELLSHAIHGWQEHLVLKQFKIVLPCVNGTNDRLSPPQYEYPDGIYILVSPLKYRRHDESLKGKDQDMTWEDYYALLPPHLQNHVWRDLSEKGCSWPLSGPQFDMTKKPSLQQRYCYPRGRDDYASTKGASLWTTYDKDNREIYSFRVLHVYFSAKRAKKRTALLLAKPPAHIVKPPKKKPKQRTKSTTREKRKARLKPPPLLAGSPPRHGCVFESKRVPPSNLWGHRSPEKDRTSHLFFSKPDTNHAVARLDATMTVTSDPSLDWGMGSLAASTEEEIAPGMKMPGGSSWDHWDIESLRPAHGSVTPRPYDDFNAGAACSPEDLDSLGAVDWNALDYLDGYQGPRNSRRVCPQPVVARAHHHISPPRGFCVLWDSQTQGVVRPVASSPVVPTRFSLQPLSVTQSSTEASETTTDDSIQSMWGAGLSYMFGEV